VVPHLTDEIQVRVAAALPCLAIAMLVCVCAILPGAGRQQGA
jgi:hypothetical protein